MKFTVPLLALAHLSSVEAVASFLPSGFNTWFWQSALAVNGRLYIDGGEIYSLTKGGDYGQTYEIDLSKSWTTANVQGNSYVRDPDFAPSRRPQLYHDGSHDVVYNFAGQLYGTLTDPPDYWSYAAPQVWGFIPDGSADGSVVWSEQFAKTLKSTFPLTTNVENGLQVSTGTKHYSLGGSMGFLSNNSDTGSRGELAMNQFITYDYATQTFENRTHPSHYVEGEAQYVPTFGEEGVLIFFAGKTPVDRNVADDNLADTGIILVYDIHNDMFYNQTATNSPVARFNLCSAGASNAQNSSYEIFMYGGTNDQNNTNTPVEMSKVWMLTLPAFHWVEVPTPADTWRTSHTCERIGPSSIAKHNQRQFISIGGNMNPDPLGRDNTEVVDAWTSGMKIFDMTALTWGDNYDASAKPYERSTVINDYYDSNSGYPASWGDPALEALFKTSRSLKVAPSPSSTSSGASPTSTSSSQPTGSTGSSGSTSPDSNGSPTENKSSSHTAAIAGGVVGGVVGLALIALAAFFWKRRTAQRDADLKASAPYVHGPAEMPVGYTDEPKVEMPGGEYYRSELP